MPRKRTGGGGLGTARRPEAAEPVARLCSCPECGTLCRRVGPSWDGQLFDIAALFPWDRMPEWAREARDLQGLGVAGPGSHRCPPTFRPLSPEPDGPPAGRP